jgi:exodeoxyribonuclease VII small subunit
MAANPKEPADRAERAAPAEQLSYEEAREELLDVVRQLESGGLPLERSLALWERGEELARVCQSWLDGARARLAARRPAQSPNHADDEPEDAG